AATDHLIHCGPEGCGEENCDHADAREDARVSITINPKLRKPAERPEPEPALR
ncbi:MAG: hypothetical protein JWM57_370, partial [Phycisphaerales bacterium]|nr:hypothetical protein [Phycisphaerales bacterium]